MQLSFYLITDILPNIVIIKGMSDGLIVLDAQDRVVDINPSAESIIGWTTSEAIGQPVNQVLSCWPDLAKEHREVTETQSEIVLGNGEEERYYDLRISPLYARRGSIAGRVIVLHNITERKKQEGLQRKVFENTQAGIFIIQDGKFRYVNPQFENYSGYTKEELLKMSSSALVSSEDRETLQENALKTLTGKGAHAYEYRLIRKNEQILWIIARVVPIEYEGRAILGSCMDITERKQEEQRKAQFINMLAHELNTPLTPILSSGKLLLEQLESKGEIEFRLARNILNGAHTLSNRLGEFLDLAKSETGLLEVNPELLEMQGLIRRIVRQYIPLFAAKKQKFQEKLEKPLPCVLADDKCVGQVLSNLLSNAHKFTPEEGQVTLKGRTEENVLVIKVEDNGPCIPLEKQATLFQPYSHSDQFSGLGLGLAICKQLVELQGGRIWYQSLPNKGNSFGFSLPLAKETTVSGREETATS